MISLKTLSHFNYDHFLGPNYDNIYTYLFAHNVKFLLYIYPLLLGVIALRTITTVVHEKKGLV